MFTLEEVERFLGIDSDDESLLQKVFFIVAEDVDDVEDMKSHKPRTFAINGSSSVPAIDIF